MVLVANVAKNNISAQICYSITLIMPLNLRMKKRLFLDKFGSTASVICALHCALLPLVLAILPAFGLGFLLFCQPTWLSKLMDGLSASPCLSRVTFSDTWPHVGMGRRFGA